MFLTSILHIYLILHYQHIQNISENKTLLVKQIMFL
jgi:hypothetical protein